MQRLLPLMKQLCFQRRAECNLCKPACVADGVPVQVTDGRHVGCESVLGIKLVLQTAFKWCQESERRLGQPPTGMDSSMAAVSPQSGRLLLAASAASATGKRRAYQGRDGDTTRDDSFKEEPVDGGDAACLAICDVCGRHHQPHQY